VTSTPRIVLAIDNGSQSTKVHLVDEHGRVHASARRALRPYALTADGHVVHPDDDVWDSIREACREALDRFDGGVDEIVAVGLCTIRFCRALLDDDGRLTEPMLSWMDERVGRAHDGAASTATHVTASSGYVTHRLTGRFRDSRASYQGLWPIDQVTGEWSSRPGDVARTGLPVGMLAELVSPGDELGTVTAEGSAATGLPVGLPVYATANDKAVEALGSGLVSEEQVLLSLGTYIAAMTVGHEPLSTSPDYWVNFAATPRSYLYESNGIRRGMWTVSWVRDLVSGEAAGSDAGLEERLGLEAAHVAPGCNGLVAVMDWLAPAEAPFRRGALLGFDGSQGRGHVYRAVLEGIALTMHGHLTRMETALGRRFEAVTVSGGGSRSDLMMQILADVLERPTVRAVMPDAAGMGAAITAAVGAGIHRDWVAATSEMVAHGATFSPSQDVATYRRIRARYEGLNDFTDPLFLALQRTPEHVPG